MQCVLLQDGLKNLQDSVGLFGVALVVDQFVPNNLDRILWLLFLAESTLNACGVGSLALRQFDM
jgi:hypothetical protein